VTGTLALRLPDPAQFNAAARGAVRNAVSRIADQSVDAAEITGVWASLRRRRLGDEVRRRLEATVLVDYVIRFVSVTAAMSARDAIQGANLTMIATVLREELSAAGLPALAQAIEVISVTASYTPPPPPPPALEVAHDEAKTAEGGGAVVPVVIIIALLSVGCFLVALWQWFVRAEGHPRLLVELWRRCPSFLRDLVPSIGLDLEKEDPGDREDLGVPQEKSRYMDDISPGRPISRQMLVQL